LQIDLGMTFFGMEKELA